MDPTIPQLRAFVCIADELHMGRAAEILRTSQPSLSHMVKKLEKCVGVALFDRSSRGTVLTPAGKNYAADTKKLLERLDRARRQANSIADGSRSLVMGYIEPAAFDLLPGTLMAFRDRFPDVELELHEMHARDQIDSLRRGDIDCALVRAPVDEPDLDHAMIHVDCGVVAVSDRRKRQRSDVALRDLANKRFIVYSPRTGTGLLKATLDSCERAGFTPQVAHQATNTPMLLALVAADEGVAVISRALSTVQRLGVQFLEISDFPVLSNVHFVWRKKEHPREVEIMLECFLEVGSRSKSQA